MQSDAVELESRSHSRRELEKFSVLENEQQHQAEEQLDAQHPEKRMRVVRHRNVVDRQISARGGELHVKIVGDRVRLGGQAVTVLRGELLA